MQTQIDERAEAIQAATGDVAVFNMRLHELAFEIDQATSAHAAAVREARYDSDKMKDLHVAAAQLSSLQTVREALESDLTEAQNRLRVLQEAQNRDETISRLLALATDANQTYQSILELRKEFEAFVADFAKRHQAAADELAKLQHEFIAEAETICPGARVSSEYRLPGEPVKQFKTELEEQGAELDVITQWPATKNAWWSPSFSFGSWEYAETARNLVRYELEKARKAAQEAGKWPKCPNEHLEQQGQPEAGEQQQRQQEPPSGAENE